MGSLSRISAIGANMEPVGFDDRNTVDGLGAAFLGRPMLMGPLTVEQQKKRDIDDAVRDAQDAQERNARATEEADRANANRIRSRTENLANSGAVLPDDMQHAVTAGELVSTKALEEVRKWLADPNSKPWLILSGTTGRGKTVAALDATATRGGVFIRARELSRAFTARFGDDHETQQRCYKTRLLVVDDLGRESDHALMCGYLEDLLDERPNRNTRTIITTNLDAKQFGAAYPDERLRSRLFKLATFVPDSGHDMRRGGGK